MKPRIMRAGTRQTSKAEMANFVGSVMSDPVWAPEGPSKLRASRVTFMPGGRTNWHQHAVGQILYVLSGIGRYQLEGQPVQAIRPGDTVVIPPNTRHWHGSAPDTMMCHLAMSETDETWSGHDMARAGKRCRLWQGAGQGLIGTELLRSLLFLFLFLFLLSPARGRGRVRGLRTPPVTPSPSLSP